MTGCEDLIRPALLDTFSESIVISEDNGDCRISMPFVRPDGDQIHLWIIKEDNEYKVTDEGETYGMLYLSGIDIESESRQQRVEATKSRFMLDSAKFEISKTVKDEQIGSAILDVYQAIQRIASLEYTRRPYPQDDFRNEVANFLEDEDIVYEPNVTVPGYAEPQTVDFSFNQVSQPTYMQAIQASSGTDLHQKSKDTAYRWMQIRRVQETSRFISLVDDIRGAYTEDRMKPILVDSDAVVRWSNKGMLRQTITG